MDSVQPSATIYPVTNYSFGTKAVKSEKDTSIGEKMNRLRDKYVYITLVAIKPQF